MAAEVHVSGFCTSRHRPGNFKSVKPGTSAAGSLVDTHILSYWSIERLGAEPWKIKAASCTTTG